jgi:hypothetical protein
MQKKLLSKNLGGVKLFHVRRQLRVLKTSSNEAVFFMQKKLLSKNRRGVKLFHVRLRLRVLKTSSNEAVFLCKRNCSRKIVEESKFFTFDASST